MSEKQSDSFDEWFREAAGQYEPPFNEEAWQKMEAKLDGKKRRRRPFAWWWLADALMAGIVLLMAATMRSTPPAGNNSGETSTATAPLKDTASSPATARPSFDSEAGPEKPGKETPAKRRLAGPDQFLETGKDGKRNDLHTPPAASSSTATVTAGLAKHPQDKKYADNVFSPLEKENADQHGTVGKSKNRDRKINDTATATAEAGENRTKPEGYETPLQTANNILATAKDLENAAAILSANQGSEPALASTDTARMQALLPPDLPLPTQGHSKTDSLLRVKKQQVTPSSKGIFLFGAAGPEWSFVPGNKLGAATIAFGGGVGYSFGKRLAIFASFSSTQKKYAASGSDYKAKPGTYFSNYTITTVKAVCAVQEILIGGRYYFKNKNRDGFYTGIGLSTLIMKKEDYGYDFQRYGQPAYYRYLYKTGNTHALAGLSVSAGYTRKLGSHIGLVAEPYVKIPLGGVGEGSVKIGSAGLMLGVQYHLWGRRK